MVKSGLDDTQRTAFILDVLKVEYEKLYEECISGKGEYNIFDKGSEVKIVSDFSKLKKSQKEFLVIISRVLSESVDALIPSIRENLPAVEITEYITQDKLKLMNIRRKVKTLYDIASCEFLFFDIRFSIDKNKVTRELFKFISYDENKDILRFDMSSDLAYALALIDRELLQ